jgi:uncharacterized protein related to proFAR isomerase
MPQRALNQRSCVESIHAVVEIASTLVAKTDLDAFWLQLSRQLHSLDLKEKASLSRRALLRALEDLIRRLRIRGFALQLTV